MTIDWTNPEKIDWKKIEKNMAEKFKRLSEEQAKRGELIDRPLQWDEYTPSDKTIVKRDWASLLKDMDWVRRTPPRYIIFQRMVGPLLIRFRLEFKSMGPYESLYSIKNLAYYCNERLTQRGVGEDFLASRWYSCLVTPCRSIKPREHKDQYLRAFEYLKKIAYLPLEGNLSLDNILHAYKLLAKDIAMREITKNPDHEIYVDEKELDVGILGFSKAGTPALVAAWAGEIEKAREYLDWGCSVLYEDERPLGNKAEFKRYHEKLIENPEALRKLVEDNLADDDEYRPKDIRAQAPYQDILGVRYQRPKKENKNNLKK